MIKSLAYDALDLLGPDFSKFKLIDDGIPVMPPNPYCSLPREKLKEFRNRYAILAEFVSEILGTKDFCLLDILAYYKKKYKK